MDSDRNPSGLSKFTRKLHRIPTKKQKNKKIGEDRFVGVRDKRARMMYINAKMQKKEEKKEEKKKLQMRAT